MEKECEREIDRFKPAFKYYKRKVPPPNLDNVIDIQKGHIILEKLSTHGGIINHSHLQDAKNWKLFKLPNGVYLISNPFKEEGISYWTLRCLKDFSVSRNNLKNENIWWNQVKEESEITDKLRWATLGFHHDWDTKIYTEQGSFPSDLSELCKTILREIPEVDSADYRVTNK